MSRPSSSVPSMWATPGGSSLPSRLTRYGSSGASQGANSALSTSRPMTMRPATAERLRRSWRHARCAFLVAGRASSAIADAWVDRAVQQIDGEVDQRDDHGREQHDALHERIVALVDRLDEQPADAWPGEDGLGDDRAAEQRADLEANHRHHRDQSIGQRVAGHDLNVA